jgi:hypothetical protein
MDQSHSVFMPGLTHRGPVYNATWGFMGDLRNQPSWSPPHIVNRGFGNVVNRQFRTHPIRNRAFAGVTNRPFAGLGDLSSDMLTYGLMAGLLYLGYKKQLPGGLAAGAAAAAAVWYFMPPTVTPTAASSAETPTEAAQSAAATLSAQLAAATGTS